MPWSHSTDRAGRARRPSQRPCCRALPATTFGGGFRTETVSPVQRNVASSGPPAAYICCVIVRVLTARVSEQNAGEFNNLLRNQLDELRGQPGLVYAKLARRLSPDRAEEVMLFEEWLTPDDLWAWTGGHLNEPRLLPGTEKLIDQLTIAHYEALDMNMDEEAWAPATSLPTDVSVRST